MTTRETQFPPGWDETRVQAVLEHYERQSEEEAVAEDEADFGAPSPSPAFPGTAGRVEAVQELASLSLPVGTPEEMERESGVEEALMEPDCEAAAEEILRLSREANSGRGETDWTRDDLHER